MSITLKQLIAVIWFFAQALYFSNTSFANEIYKWVDKDGKIHYSETPPPNQAQSLDYVNDANFTTINFEPVEVEYYQGGSKYKKETKKTKKPKVKNKEVWMFSTPSCGYCRKASAYFDKNGIKYRELYITENDKYKQWFKAFGGSGVPLILVGQRGEPAIIKGFNESQLGEYF